MTDDTMRDAPADYSRRAMLKRGAVVGAAAVWAVPTVQAISMVSASAESPSAPQPPSPPGTPSTPPTSSTPSTPPATGTSGAPGVGAASVSTGGATSGTSVTAGQQLAYTGFDALPVATAGLGLIAAGAAVTAAVRAKDEGTTSAS